MFHTENAKMLFESALFFPVDVAPPVVGGFQGVHGNANILLGAVPALHRNALMRGSGDTHLANLETLVMEQFGNHLICTLHCVLLFQVVGTHIRRAFELMPPASHEPPDTLVQHNHY